MINKIVNVGNVAHIILFADNDTANVTVLNAINGELKIVRSDEIEIISSGVQITFSDFFLRAFPKIVFLTDSELLNYYQQ